MDINQSEIKREVKGQLLAELEQIRHLVTPGALNNCFARCEEVRARILDISYVRVVLEQSEDWSPFQEGQIIPMMLSCGNLEFPAELKVQGRGEGWIRFHFEKLVPSSKSCLRLFLSPKKIGESMMEDRRVPEVRHYHGLNESELWFDKDGNILFTYLDHMDAKYQFLVQVSLENSSVKVGRLTRTHYMNMESLYGDLGLLPLNDKENYARMSECRDIITNFRTSGQVEYHLKQKLLKLISESLYSTGHRVEFPMVRAVRLPYLTTEH